MPRNNSDNTENGPTIILLSYLIIIIIFIIIVTFTLVTIYRTPPLPNYPLPPPPKQSREYISPTRFKSIQRAPATLIKWHFSFHRVLCGAVRISRGMLYNWSPGGEVAYLIFIVLHDNRVQRASDTTARGRCSVK